MTALTVETARKKCEVKFRVFIKDIHEQESTGLPVRIGFGPRISVHELAVQVYWPETKGHPIVYDQFQLELIEERNVKNIYKVRKIELRTENETREIDQVRLSLFCDS